MVFMTISYIDNKKHLNLDLEEVVTFDEGIGDTIRFVQKDGNVHLINKNVIIRIFINNNYYKD